MKKLKASDEVIVIAGKDKGKTGVIEKRIGDKLVVEGCNLVTKHKKGDPNRGITGGIIREEAPIHQSNVAILNGQTGKADKVGFVVDDSGQKRRVYRSTGEFIDS